MVYTAREAIGFAAFLVGAAALTAVNHHPDHGRRTERERAAVEAAATHVSHEQIAAAWTQMKVGHHAPLDSIEAVFPLPLRATYGEEAAIVLTFDGHDDTCVDLVSWPGNRSVTARDC